MPPNTPKPPSIDVAKNDTLFRLMVEGVPDYAIFMLDPTGRVATWNTGAQRIKGYLPSEIIGCHFSTFYPQEDIAAGKPEFELRVAAQVGRFEDEGWRKRKDGSRFWANVVITAVRDETGRLLGYTKVTRDLTTRKAAEDALRVSEQGLTAILNSIADAVIATDNTGLVTRLNPVAERLTGWVQSEALGRPVEEIFHIVNEDTGETAPSPVERVLREGLVMGLANHTALVSREGDERPIADSAAPIRSPDGRTNGAVLVFRDVTEERRAEEALRRSEERFRLLVDGVRDYALMIISPAGTVGTWNRGAERINGYASDEIIGRPLATFYREEDIDAGKPERELLLANRDGRFEEEGWRVRKDGTHYWANVIVTPLRNAEGRLFGFAKVTRDLTERRRAEEQERELFREQAVRLATQRREAQTRFLAHASAQLANGLSSDRTLQRAAQLAVPYMADWCSIEVPGPDGQIQTVASVHQDPAKVEMGRAFQSHYPTAPDAPSGAPLVIRTGEPELYPEISQELLLATAKDEAHARAIQAFGLKSAMVVPIRARGRTLGAMTFCTSESGRRYDTEDLALAADLAHRAGSAFENALLFESERAAREQAEHALQLRDDFLSVAGHELRTPLTALQLQISSLVRIASRTSLDPRFSDRLSRALSYTTRLERLVEDLLDVSRITGGRLTLARAPLDLSLLVREVLDRFADEAERAGCRVTVHAAPVVGEWDGNRIDQVLTNLLSNAIKYGKGTPVTVRVEHEPGADGGQAVVTVADRGIGIAPEHQGRIFGRFERAVSERNYGGLGIGLWISREIVEAHGGSIAVSSSAGEGASFVMRLPIKPPVAT